MPGRAPSTMVKANRSLPNNPVMTIADGRPTWPHHATNQQSRNKHQNGIFITSGEIGTNAMHPPGKRQPVTVSQTSSKSNSYVFLRGRAQRPSPTQRICFNERQYRSRTGPHKRRFVTSSEIGTNAMHPSGKRTNPSQRVRHHHNVQALCFPVRADTAVRLCTDRSPRLPAQRIVT